MKRIWLWARAALIGVLVVSCKRDVKEIMSETRTSVVRIQVITLTGERQNGSGFIIDKRGFIVTNDHVLGDPREITIRLHNDQAFTGEEVGIVYRNQLQDIAILKVNALNSNLPSLVIAEPPSYLEDVYAIGYPMGQFKTTSGKITSNEETILEEFSYLAIDATLDPGYSGAPVVDKAGRVLGIATRIAGKNMNYAVPIRYVRSILDKANILLSNLHDTVRVNNQEVVFQDDFGESDSNNWIEARGNWVRRGNGYYAQISHVLFPYQKWVYGLTVTQQEVQDFYLKSKMRTVARFDGYKNLDMAMVFRFVDECHFYSFSTYSGEGDEPIWRNDKGGLWKVENCDWKLLQISSSLQAFQSERWYDVKIVAQGGHIQVFVDNLKCIDVVDNSFSRGRVGYRTTSSHAWFSSLKLFRL